MPYMPWIKINQIKIALILFSLMQMRIYVWNVDLYILNNKNLKITCSLKMYQKSADPGFNLETSFQLC